MLALGLSTLLGLCCALPQGEAKPKNKKQTTPPTAERPIKAAQPGRRQAGTGQPATAQPTSVQQASARAPAEKLADIPAPEDQDHIDRSVDLGLAWLADRQSRHGYWQADIGHKQGNNYMILRAAEVNEARGRGHLGVTAIAGMAFIAGGHLPDRGRYGTVVRRTVDYLLQNIQESGLITDGGTRMYSHAFATLFLAEIHGMGPKHEIKRGLERAVNLIVDSQNKHGAWRYNAFSQNADLSVTVCQLQALRAARNIGIKVPRSTIDAAVSYVKASQSREGLYYYKIHGRGSYRKNHDYAVNAAAITALNSAGISDEKLIAPALSFLQDQYSELSMYYGRHYFYWYGNYYACQAFFQAGGPRFDTYYRGIRKDLLRMQESAGHWRNDTGPGHVFSTAIACLILQLPRQYLPIFQR